MGMHDYLEDYLDGVSDDDVERFEAFHNKRGKVHHATQASSDRKETRKPKELSLVRKRKRPDSDEDRD